MTNAELSKRLEVLRMSSADSIGFKVTLDEVLEEVVGRLDQHERRLNIVHYDAVDWVESGFAGYEQAAIPLEGFGD